MPYVDGYVLAVPTKKLANYKKVASKAGKVWREHGALEYWECAGDDMKPKCGLPFPKMARAKPSETIIFAWVIYKNRKDRDQVNAKVFNDPRLPAMMENSGMEFDMSRMAYGGFKPIVQYNK